jgi:hypothetical protein
MKRVVPEGVECRSVLEEHVNVMSIEVTSAAPGLHINDVFLIDVVDPESDDGE